MNISEARNCILELAQYYFQKAKVVFAKQSFAVKKNNPLVTLSFGSINIPLNPPTKVIDGRPVSFYPTTMMVQIDLYTPGRKIEIASDVTPVMENTAVEDLLAFVNFLNSEHVIQYCHQKDIAIVIPNTVQDLTDLINDTNYQYRAMVEIEFRFTSVAVGYTGTLSHASIKDDSLVVPKVEETASGGGNSEVESQEEDYFDNVAINNKLVKEEDKQ